MSTANFSDDFKRDAVAQIIGWGYPVAEVSKRLGVSPHSLFQACQAASMMASQVSNTRLESQFWRRYCQISRPG